jgi:TonB-dependent receptor
MSDQVERVFSAQGLEEAEVDYLGQTTTRQVTWGGLLNSSYELSSSDRLRLDLMANQLTEDDSRILQGFNLDSSTDQRNTRIRYLQQRLLNGVLKGEHLFESLGSSKLDWSLGYTRASRYEPNTREVLYRANRDGEFVFDNFIQSGSVFHQDLVDSGYSGSLDYKVPLEIADRDWTLTAGGSARMKDRDTYSRRFRFSPVPGGIIGDSIRKLEPNELLRPEHIRTDGFELQEATFRADNYSAEENIYAGYVMFEGELADSWSLLFGARVEDASQTVTPLDLWETTQEPLPPANLSTTDILPAVSLTWEAIQDLNLRASFSQTLARPELRELAPFQFADYAGGYLVIGNPQLERALVTNYDLRGEWFFAPGALVAVSGFWKDFQNPIEVTVLPSSELIKTWVSAESASNYGVEFEFRSSLAPLADAFQNFSVNVNATVVESQVETGDTARVYLPGTGPAELAVVSKNRALQGQSPYVVNVGLNYFNGETGSSASILYNRFGRRIDAVGGQASPDIFEEARGQLDVVFEQQLSNRWKVKMAGSRLTGHEMVFTQGGDVLRSWDAGAEYSISFSWGGGER